MNTWRPEGWDKRVEDLRQQWDKDGIISYRLASRSTRMIEDVASAILSALRERGMKCGKYDCPCTPHDANLVEGGHPGHLVWIPEGAGR